MYTPTAFTQSGQHFHGDPNYSHAGTINGNYAPNPTMYAASPPGYMAPPPPVDQFASMSIHQNQPNWNAQPMYPPSNNGFSNQPAFPTGPTSPHYPSLVQHTEAMSKQPLLPPAPPVPPLPMSGQHPSTHRGPPPVGQLGYEMSAPVTSQPKRISVDSFPSAVQVIESGRAEYSSFSTAERNVVPPLVSTDFTCVDSGNCNPRFVRSSMYAVPTSADMMKTIGIPFTLTISPFANLHPDDHPPVLSDMGSDGPVRCNRCLAFMNPFAAFIDGGRRFQCPLCDGLTSVPDNYFTHLDHTGKRTDTYHRPELCLGSYELTTTVEYCLNNELPNAPAFIFILDVSQTSIRSGLVQLFCSQFVDMILPHLPRDSMDCGDSNSQLKVGFITYDHQLHFYSMVREKPGHNGTVQNGDDGQVASHDFGRPQMHIVADVNDVFVPAVEGFLVSPDPGVIQNLLHLVSTQLCVDPSFAAPDAMLGPAVQAGLEALRAAKRPGKLFVFNSNLPTADGPGKLQSREDPRLIGTDKEKTLITPCDDYYTNLGQACVEAGCSVDLFLFPNSFTDVATLSEIPRVTSGHLYKYSCFQADLQGLQFISDLKQAVSRPKAFDALLRVRTSTGIRPVDFFGNFYLPNTTDVALACLDPDTSLTVEIKHDDKLQDNDVAFIQVACLYTGLSGQRRLRIHNLSLSTTSSISEVYRLAELDTHMNWLFKYALRSLCRRPHSQVVEELTGRIAHTLASYRRHSFNQPGDAGGDIAQLILPHDMKLYPLYVQCLMKSEAFLPADTIPIDERARLIFLVAGMDVKRSSMYLYPRLYPVHQLPCDGNGVPVYPPPSIRCCSEYLQPDAAYLMDNGVHLFLWLGPNLSEEWIQAVLTGSHLGPFEAEKIYELPQLDSEASRRLRSIVSKIHEERSSHSRLLVIRSGDKLEGYFRRFLVEDRCTNHTLSYAEYLCHLQKEVRNLLR